MYGREKRITVSFRQTMIGHYSERLELLFEDIALKQRFFILRVLKAISLDANGHSLARELRGYGEGIPKTVKITACGKV